MRELNSCRGKSAQIDEKNRNVIHLFVRARNEQGLAHCDVLLLLEHLHACAAVVQHIQLIPQHSQSCRTVELTRRIAIAPKRSQKSGAVGGVHANTTQLQVCGDDVAICGEVQITCAIYADSAHEFSRESEHQQHIITNIRDEDVAVISSDSQAFQTPVHTALATQRAHQISGRRMKYKHSTLFTACAYENTVSVGGDAHDAAVDHTITNCPHGRPSQRYFLHRDDNAVTTVNFNT